MPVFVRQAPRQRYWLHAVLLLATFFTTLIVGARMQYNFLNNQSAFSLDDSAAPFFPVGWIISNPGRLLLGIPFAGTLLLILMAHEMGHYFYCKRYGVWATLPFFIPAPTLFGTFGAFIRIRSPIRSRTALFDIGIAGPIAGFVVAVGVLVASLGFSKAMPTGMVVPGLEIGFPRIFLLVQSLLVRTGVGNGVLLSPLNHLLLPPTAFAAWVGMFATSLNLLPGGQLDGGHMIFALVPGAHKFVSRLTILVLLPMAYYFWAGWIIWAILLQLSSLRHPQVAELPRVSGGRIWLAAFALLMLALTLTPAPFAHASLPDFVQQIRGQ
jgi:membrane-associated protease RseP (regulator of RpoE activity)